MNPTIDNDLQKAIDDITKITDDDPIFADAVAAPAPTPAENLTATPAPAPKPRMSMPMNNMPPMPARPSTPTPITPAPAAEEIVTTTEKVVAKDVEPFVSASSENLDKDQVKEAALRDLAPILDKLDIPSEKKFDIYKTVINDYNDSSVIAPAYKTATDIKDDKERGEALLYLIESIDKM